MLEFAILFAAVILDLVFKEPPLKIHPVVWFGKTVHFFEKFLFKNPSAQLAYGILVTLLILTFAYILSIIPLPYLYKFFWDVYLLFSSISIGSMLQHAKACLESNFTKEEVQKIVSRDTSKLEDYQLRSAVIESTAENYVDGVLSPLFYFALFGVSGAIVYRAINLCDSMIGYRGKYEYFGKFAAKLDDVANFIPARLSLIFFEILKRGAFKFGLKNRVKLNGCSISAMSYVLGVKLEKPGYYSLPGRKPEDADVIRTMSIFKLLSFFTIILTSIILGLKIFILAI